MYSLLAELLCNIFWYVK